MAEKEFKYVLEFQSTATGTGAKETVDGLKGVDAAQQKMDAQFSRSGNTIEKVAAGPIQTLTKNAAQATGGVKNLGMVATQVGYQVTDFATQVSMGTSAITAFAMQAPQAIAALTQFGGASGGLKEIMMSTVSTGTVFSLVATEIAIGAKPAIDEYENDAH